MDTFRLLFLNTFKLLFLYFLNTFRLLFSYFLDQNKITANASYSEYILGFSFIHNHLNGPEKLLKNAVGKFAEIPINYSLQWALRARLHDLRIKRGVGKCKS